MLRILWELLVALASIQWIRILKHVQLVYTIAHNKNACSCKSKMEEKSWGQDLLSTAWIIIFFLLFFFLKLYLCYIYDTSLFLVLSVLGNSKALTYQYPLLEVLSVLTEEEE